jgi:hypothetical protein
MEGGFGFGLRSCDPSNATPRILSDKSKVLRLFLACGGNNRKTTSQFDHTRDSLNEASVYVHTSGNNKALS